MPQHAHNARFTGDELNLSEPQRRLLASWSARAWSKNWNNRPIDHDLSTMLSAFLTTALHYANAEESYKPHPRVAIVEAILLGIADSNTHSRKALESALSVTFPIEET